jgi:Protein of unknown function (DUF3631)
MNNLSLAEMARRLGGELSGGQIRCPGPGHSPEDRSLSVKLKDDGTGIVVHSFSGDDPIMCKDHVRKKLGLPPFRPRKKSNGKDTRKVVAAHYDYMDESGAVLFQVVRFEPKTFRQRKPDGNGKWTWKLADVRRVLFRLPELIEGIAADHPVFIVEGEKDVLALNKLGIIATTNPGGAGKWRCEFSEVLRGADVILIPDNDDAGWEHVNQIGAQLCGQAARLRVLVLPNLPPKGDFSDWASSGGTREQLDELVAQAPDWKSPQATTIPDKAKATASEDELIANLAKMEPGIQFGRERKKLMKQFDVHASDIDAAVKAYREDAEVAPLYGHWIVEPWPEPVEGDSLLRDIIKRIHRHVVISHDGALVVALWIMLSWVHDEIATHSPILNINSAEPESGKSTTMGLVAFLMPKCIASVEASEAAIYRAIKRWAPSFCFDEFDSILAGDDKAGLRSVINSGHTKGSGVMRCIGDDNTPEMFPTFAPKVIGMVGRKLPPATLSRCIFVELRRRKRDECVEKFRHRDDSELADLRRRLRRWAMDNEDILRSANPTMPDELTNRRADNWSLQLAIADLCSGVEDFGDKARAAAIKIEGTTDSRTVNVKALAVIQTVFASIDDDAISSEDLIRNMTADPDSEWAEWKNGKPVSQAQLARLLKRYGIIPERVQIGGQRVRGYKRVWFIEAWERYL